MLKDICCLDIFDLCLNVLLLYEFLIFRCVKLRDFYQFSCLARVSEFFRSYRCVVCLVDLLRYPCVVVGHVDNFFVVFVILSVSVGDLV